MSSNLSAGAMAQALRVCVAVVALGAPWAHAQPSGQGLALDLGYHDDYRRVGLIYATPTLWSHAFQNGWGHVDLNVEINVSYWREQGAGAHSMGQAGATPVLRWRPTDRFYLELGSGLNMFSRSRFAGENLSTRFQFGSFLGAGFVIRDTHQLGVRVSHFSNAGLKKPNPGLELISLTYTHRF